MPIWAVTGATFLATALVVLLVFYAFSPANQKGREATKMASLQGAESADLKEVEAQRMPESDRRRSPRLDLQVPVFVYGHASDDEPFYEETKTLQVNVHGGLIALAMGVKRGQRLLLANGVTEKEQECHVVHLGPKHFNRKTNVAIEFMQPVRDFWGTET